MTDDATSEIVRAFASAPERYVLVAPRAQDYRVIEASDAYLRLIATTRDDFVGRSLLEVFPPAASPAGAGIRELYESLAAAADTGTPQVTPVFRYDIADADTPGRAFERYWSSHVLPICTDDGEVTSLLIRVEEATDYVLRERYRRRGQSTEDAEPRRRRVLIVEPDAHLNAYLRDAFETQWAVESVTTAEQAFEAIERDPPHAVLASMNLPGSTGPDFISQLKQLVPIPLVIRVDQTDGRLYAEAFEAGADDVIGGPVLAREFMARVQAQMSEAALRELTKKRSRQQYHQLFMQAPVAIALMMGPEKRFVLSNPAHDRLVDGRQLLGLPLREAIPDAKAQPYLDRIDEVYRSGEPFVATEVGGSLETDDEHDAPRYTTFAYVPFFGPHGEVEGIASFSHDVTEQVEMRRAVERESRRKDEFLAMLGHELRNPLAPIATANDLLRMTADSPDPAQIQWASDMIDRQIRQLRRLVDDLLDVARISQGRISIEPAMVEVSDIVECAVETVQVNIEKRDQNLEISTPAESIHVEVDGARINQAVANLLDNASKYTPDGGCIWLEAAVGEHDGESSLTIVVRDDGKGIPEDFLSEIFDQFSQADVSIDRAQGGLGLGLTVVEQIVHLHDGTVTATSDGPGQGASFTLQIPATVQPADQTPADAPSPC